MSRRRQRELEELGLDEAEVEARLDRLASDEVDRQRDEDAENHFKQENQDGRA